MSILQFHIYIYSGAKCAFFRKIQLKSTMGLHMHANSSLDRNVMQWLHKAICTFGDYIVWRTIWLQHC
jgi:hypothetical protein